MGGLQFFAKGRDYTVVTLRLATLSLKRRAGSRGQVAYSVPNLIVVCIDLLHTAGYPKVSHSIIKQAFATNPCKWFKTGRKVNLSNGCE